MRALNPDQLRTFVDVVELGSFTAAARRLNLSQPAVSLQIRELEARCGVQLLDRVGKKPFPTLAGRQLLVHAHRILNESEDALAAMQRLRNSSGRQVRLGMTTATLNYLMRDTIRHLKKTRPTIDLTVVLASSQTMADDVRNHNLDLAIVSLPVDDSHLSVETFYQDRVTAIVPDAYFDQTPAAATPHMLSSAPFVVQRITDVQTRLVQSWFRSTGHTPHSFVEVHTLEGCRAAVAAGLGVSIVPGIMAADPIEGLQYLPLNPDVTRHVAIIEHKDRPVNPEVDMVRSALLAGRMPAAARQNGRFVHAAADNGCERV
jgi:DNA-binding transcriptional LysR family regulator